MAGLRLMNSRYKGRCKKCGAPFASGERIYWSKKTGALCLKCGAEAGTQDEGSKEIPKGEGTPAPKREKIEARNPSLPPTVTKDRDNYFTIEWSDLREVVRSAVFNQEVPAVKSKRNGEHILRHCRNLSAWHGYTDGQLERWITEGYDAAVIHGLGEFNPPLREKRRYRYTEDGDEILIDRALSGDDDYMAEWTKRENIPGVAVEAEIMFCSSVSAEIVNAWNVFLCRAMLTLETTGIDTQVTLKFSSDGAASGDSRNYHSIVRVKRENEATDFRSFSAMLSPAALRTFGFTSLVLQSDQNGKDASAGLGSGHNGREWAIVWNGERRVLEFRCPYMPHGNFPAEDLERKLRAALHAMKTNQ